MAFQSIYPADGQLQQECPVWDAAQLETALAEAAQASQDWAAWPVAERCQVLRDIAARLRERRGELARLITTEMGKLSREAEGEVEKCAWVCEYYADYAAEFLADEVIASDASRSLVAYQPLGLILAIMPWNFPLWQVFRFAAPALAAGNGGLLKHAANVPQCALVLEEVMTAGGLPAGVFRSVMIDTGAVQGVIEDPRVAAVTLTGSESAGRQVAASAGASVKKTVLELGGSDPCVVLADADLELAAQQAVASRFLNAGQSCIAAKRFIVVESIAERFVGHVKSAIEDLQPGDPMDPATTLAPMARADLRDELHDQVERSLSGGATAVTGCQTVPGPGFFYQPSLLDHVMPGMPAFDEELFGPVAAVVRAADEEAAVTLANQSRFGLGASVWTQDSQRGEALARRIHSGACFVNGVVKSDPRLPFGGVKASGYGRELCHHGIHEFVNAKTIWLR